MKKYLQSLLNRFGYKIVKIRAFEPNHIGNIVLLLSDLKERGLKCSFILDVGANKTDWSRMAKTVFADSFFGLIEPIKELEPILSDFCKENKGSFYCLAGAGSKKSKLTLNIGDSFAGASLLYPDGDGVRQEVDIITIDDIIIEKKLSPPQIIKIDVQGFELEVLKGALSTFGHTEVYILEVSLFSYPDMKGAPTFAEVINFMLDKGYVVYDFPGFLRRPYDNALGQCDLCFVKEKGFLKASHTWH